MKKRDEKNHTKNIQEKRPHWKSEKFLINERKAEKGRVGESESYENGIVNNRKKTSRSLQKNTDDE